MGSGDEVEATKTNGARVSVRLGIDVGKMGRNVSRSRINGPDCLLTSMPQDVSISSQQWALKLTDRT